MLEPETLYRLQFVSDPRVSNDGRLAAYVLTRIEDEKPAGERADENEKAKKVYRSAVWLSRGGRPAAPFTAGTSRDSSPRFSPDGGRLAFLSARSEKTQLFVMPVDGGEARALTRLKAGVNSPAWSPDGTRLAFLSQGDREDKRGEEGAPRVVERLHYKANGIGGPGLVDEQSSQQLWVVSAEGGEPVRLTDHPEDVDGFDWLPDSSGLVFVAAESEAEEAEWRTQLYLVPAAGGLTRRLSDWRGTIGAPAVSPDGRHVAVQASEEPLLGMKDPHLHLLELPADGALARLDRLDRGLDFAVGNSVNGDAHFGAAPAGPVWQADGSLLALYTLGGRGVVVRVAPGGGAVPVLEAEAANIVGFHANRAGDLAYLQETASALGEAYLRRGGEEAVRLSRAAEAGLDGLELSGELEHLKLERDGFTVEGWLMKPAGWRADGRFPVVLEIHGGPQTAYGHGFSLEFQLLASRGIAVLFANIRGSAGYGQAQREAVRGAYGQGDHADLMALFDEALGRYPWLDGSRAGVIGGSYGGFMTNWIVSHTGRFRAAVTDRSICNFLSFYGTSDIGYRFAEDQLAGRVPGDLEGLWEASPLKHVERVSTPCLIIHSEEDHRCPIEQGEQWFVALKRRGVETRFVRFPGESHELSRSGRPDRRVVRLREILGWFERHLQGA